MNSDELIIRNDERKKIGEELHDKISIEVLQLQFLLLKSESFLSSELFSKIMSQTDTVRSQIRNLSHKFVKSTLVDHKQVSLSKTIKDILLDFVYLHSDLTFNLYLFPKQHPFIFSPTLVAEMQKVISELIYNSIIHGKSDIIECSLTDHPDFVDVMLTDNGLGFDVNKKTDGIGLLNCKNRIEKLKGQILIESKGKKGVTINIKIRK